jgi:hypothetical protein
VSDWARDLLLELARAAPNWRLWAIAAGSMALVGCGSSASRAPLAEGLVAVADLPGSWQSLARQARPPRQTVYSFWPEGMSRRNGAR